MSALGVYVLGDAKDGSAFTHSAHDDFRITGAAISAARRRTSKATRH